MKHPFSRSQFVKSLWAHILQTALYWVAVILPAVAQNPVFNCGSNGSYGPLNITENTTLQVPPDGIFHCTTVNIAYNEPSGQHWDRVRVLNFTKNALNTPVYILATGDVFIGGAISVEGTFTGLVAPGIGGPGGYDGGQGHPSGYGGDGQGPGGGKGARNGQAFGNGSYKIAGVSANSGPTYGSSLLIPLVGGSGGGGTTVGGGGGGGAILIASNTKITFQTPQNYGVANVRATGGFDGSLEDVSPTGSGGAIRIVAPIVEGHAGFSVKNRYRTLVGPSNTYSSKAGSGYIRIDSWDYSRLTISDGEFYGAALDRPDAWGSVMMVFPTPMPKLSISNAAGTPVAENIANRVTVTLPSGSSTSQTIQVRARDFGGIVPIRVRLVPESGDAAIYDSSIDNTVNNPATVNVPVSMPINVGVSVQVYTR